MSKTDGVMPILLSYIIPVYNGDKYLRKCLDSIILQESNLDQYEIICVDDCSVDTSRDILLEYAAKYKNIHCVFNANNMKTGTSLNNVLKFARGKYVWFIGQDDTIELHSSIKLLHLCEKYNLDVIAFNYNKINSLDNLLESCKIFSNTNIQDGRTYVRSYFYNDLCYYLLGYSWRAVYNLDFLKHNHIVFPNNTIYEDTTYMFKAFWRAKNMMTIEDCFYNYRQNNFSITHVSNRYQAVRIFDFFMINDEVVKCAESIDDEHVKLQLMNISNKYLRSFLYSITPATIVEKLKFYNLVKLNWYNIKLNILKLPWYLQILLYPNLGIILTSLLKPIWLFKHVIITQK